MNDPRTSTDPQLQAALRAWDGASASWNESYDDAMRIYESLRDTSSHQAFGWAALTGGRIAAYRGGADQAEMLLAEALGRFLLAGDTYGEQMAISHLAIPQVARRNLDRALEFALKPLASGVSFSNLDRSLLHNDAAMCYWARDESHDAISHLVREFNLVKDSGNLERNAAVLGNIGAVLLALGEWELALSVSTNAWRLQLRSCTDRNKLQVSQLSNIVILNCYLGDQLAALTHAEELLDLLAQTGVPGRWMTHLNIVEAFALNGKADKASACLVQARAIIGDSTSEFSLAHLRVAEANLHWANRDFGASIKLAMMVVNQPMVAVKRGAHLAAALVLARSFRAAGPTSEAMKWKRYLEDLRRERSLGDILSGQIRANLTVDQPNEPLTERELTCLALAARGQTSADIALKLGITTRTVNFHFGNILRKLNAANRQEAIAKAAAANLLRNL